MRLNTVSIESVRNPESLDEEEIAEESTAGKPTEPFSQDALVAAWKNYAHLMKKQEKMGFASTMLAYDPKKDDNKVIVTVDNDVQVQYFEREKTELVNWFRKRLNNWAINLEFVIAESDDEDNNKYLTPVEKFKRMAEKNPSLDDLRERLNLDIER